VLQKEQVKTLSRELFDRVDRLDAPRLVEYWEKDPCAKQDEGYGYSFSDDPLAAGGFGPNDATIRVRPAPVRVLNRFAAGEYEIVILGADDSLSLASWLHEHGYAIPEGAEPVLRPYVQGGMKFFVARVNPHKVRFVHGRATLSPLRFHYDSEGFALPVRLGLVNSPGTQDLIVHILSRGWRYEVANRPNAVIPTNLDLEAGAADAFGPFYSALFDRARAARPRAVFTEYAWDAASCDPCPGPALGAEDLAALGAEVLPGESDPLRPGFVLTRLHARYTKEDVAEDLVFRAAPPIAGGREVYESSAALERGAHPDAINNFQGRYAIRHRWEGEVHCPNPLRGRWEARPPIPAASLGFVVPAPGEAAGEGPDEPESLDVEAPAQLPPHGGCAACAIGGAPGERLGALAAVAGVAVLVLRRSRRRRPW
jgi:hypothetical protein